ncbi:hypothetical protein RHMOL_Rhmol04G0114600 [Rhododendron molle]|uniref:Uncharacterized protein n=1 Tax=Rhododendron molle TaxID=49168 RepID=A0ACC0P1R4_RHOML|nr:hypothetical protein RHMOL_Rhmol04G0114600 [Rhododendron molle]
MEQLEEECFWVKTQFFPIVRGLIFPQEDDISVMPSSSRQHVITPSASHGALSSTTSPAQPPAPSSIWTRLRSHISTTWLPCQLRTDSACTVSRIFPWLKGIFQNWFS